MEFFEKLGKKATETFNSAAEKTNKIAADTKLKIRINDCKSKINELYKEIGKKVYEKYVLDGSFDVKDDVEESLSKISELTDEIEGYERERLELKDMKQCEKCKNKIDRSAKFCPVCGAEQPEEEIHEAEVVGEETHEENNEPQSDNTEKESVQAEVVEDIKAAGEEIKEKAEEFENNKADEENKTIEENKTSEENNSAE